MTKEQELILEEIQSLRRLKDDMLCDRIIYRNNLQSDAEKKIFDDCAHQLAKIYDAKIEDLFSKLKE